MGLSDYEVVLKFLAIMNGMDYSKINGPSGGLLRSGSDSY